MDGIGTTALHRDPRWIAAAKVALILTATFLALYYRRPDQFFAPYIWVEDGTVSLPQYLRDGWRYLFEPVAGYLILPSKLIQLAALTLSGRHYPEIAYWGNLLFHAAVLCCIAFSRTTLKYPLLCALFTLLIPTDSEVFGTSHYAFWWGSLLLLPPLLWQQEDTRLPWARCFMVVLGGLSSPLVVVLLALFLLRNLLHRSRNELVITVLAIGCACVQLYFILSSGTHGSSLPDHLSIALLTEKFLGNFVYWAPSSPSTLWIGDALLASLVLAALIARKRLQWSHFALATILAASTLISVSRAPLEMIDPFGGGPRYFFYPYIFLGWLLIELAPVVPRALGAVLALAVLAGLPQFIAYTPRGHHAIDWNAELTRCAEASTPYNFPIHFTGNRNQLWGVKLSPAECRRIGTEGLLDRSLQ
ncbi:hypothetical protein XarbCFBP7610_03505 [Xanthomonas arboricola]|nr:hypothetical protein XarbCFBP7610_03505 [Xanthomonas arboricola]